MSTVNAGTAVDPNTRQPMIQGSPNTVPNVLGLGKNVLNLVDLYRYNHDRSEALTQATNALRDQPPGSAVIITETASRYGNREFGGVHYQATYVGRVQSVESAIDEVSGPRLESGDPNAISHSYVVYSGDSCPTDTKGVSLITTDQANALR